MPSGFRRLAFRSALVMMSAGAFSAMMPAFFCFFVKDFARVLA